MLKVPMASSDERDRPLVVTDEYLQYLAGELTKEWRDVARYLKISEGTIFNKTTDNQQDVKEAKYQTLLFWKRRKGEHATHEVLDEALSKANRSDLSKGSNILQKDALHEDKELNFSPDGQRSNSENLAYRIPSGKKGQLVKELKNKYRVLCGNYQPVPFLKDKYNIDQLYVESEIKILVKDIGNEDQENWRKLKNYKTIFTDPQITSKRLIIDGEPGYGKSTLALQMTHDWCRGTAPMENFEILILLRLRQFKSVPTIFSAIKKFLLPKDTELTEDDITSILKSSSTLILLDGYDEYPHRGNQESDIEHIIRGDMFQDHIVVLETRISCQPPDYQNATNERFRLAGFDEFAREMFIQKLAGGRSEVANKISNFFKEDPVSADFCKIPLFFTMISYMVTKSKKLQNLKTVTQFFNHIFKCFFSHNDLKKTEGDRQVEIDHSMLDEVAFKGLSSDTQQISWDTNELVDNIGHNVYNEYVRIGILIEEENFDFDTLEYKTETRFFHKLFAEWYAAHYFAKLAAKPEVEFESWTNHRSLKLDSSSSPDADTPQPQEAAKSDKEHLLKCPNPDDLHYMYRFACGLSRDAAVKIIRHLGTEEFSNYTLLCITEFNASLDPVEETIRSFCNRSLHLDCDDTSLYQKSVIALLKFFSGRKIEVCDVQLNECLIVEGDGTLRVKPSNLPLPLMNPVNLTITETVRNTPITEEQIHGILQYVAKCLNLTSRATTDGHGEECKPYSDISFFNCLPARYIKVTDVMLELCRRDLIIEWNVYYKQGPVFLNLESGQWEDWESDFEVVTDEEGGKKTVLKQDRLSDRQNIWKRDRKVITDEEYEKEKSTEFLSAPPTENVPPIPSHQSMDDTVTDKVLTEA